MSGSHSELHSYFPLAHKNTSIGKVNAGKNQYKTFVIRCEKGSFAKSDIKSFMGDWKNQR